MKKHLLHIVFALSTALSFSQEGAKVTVSHDTVRIGDQFMLELSLTGHLDDDSLFSWPEFDNFITDEIEIIDRTQLQKKVIDSITQTSLYIQQFLLTSFEEGTQVIPPFEFITSDSIYSTEQREILVNTVAVDTSKGIFDVKPIFEVDYSVSARVSDWFKENWYWFVIGLLLIAITILFIRYRNRPQVIVEPPKPKIPAHISALTILNELQKEQAWENDNKKEYYSMVTDTIRKYLEERFDILALEKTTVEIIKDLKYSDIISKDKFFLQEILRQADLVKFAKFKPDNADGEIVLNKSIEFVERTKKNDPESMKIELEDE